MVRTVANTGFTSLGGLHNITADDVAIIGETYWAGIPDGSPINIAKAQRSVQERFAKASGSNGPVAFMPLIPPGIDEMIQKAIFNTDPYMEKEECGRVLKANKDQMDKMTREYLDKVISKAETTTSNLMHVIADEQVTYLYKRPYPFQALIPAQANKGKTALWDAVGPYGDMGSAAFGTEDPTLQESDMNAWNRTDTIKYMYSVGRLTKASKLAGLTQVPARDLKAIRVDMAQDSIRALRERTMLGVTRDLKSTSNEFVPAGPLEYKGVHELITDNVGTGAVGAQLWVDVASSNVNTFQKLNEKLDETYNKLVLYGISPNLAFCDFPTFGLIRRGMTDFVRYLGEPAKTLVPGVQKLDLVFPNEGGLSLVPHSFLPMATGSYGNIFLMDTRLMARRVLWQDTYEELANTNTSDKFVISSAETMIDRTAIDANSSLHGGVFGITR
jgi:hypothetical protein